MNIYIILGILVLIGLVAFVSLKAKRDLNKTGTVENKTSNLNYEKKQDNRILKLVVMYDFAQTSKTISEKATTELIERTMKLTDWEKFHMVYLEDKNGNSLGVSGSLYEDGLSSGYVNNDVHLLKTNPPESVEEMTEILLDFLKGEDVWRNKHKYE